MHRATKIVATLGPASSDPEILSQMIRAGVDVVRLNFSHGTAQDHIDRADAGARGGAPSAAARSRIMADLQGPKIRVGKFDERQGHARAAAPSSSSTPRATELGDIERVGLDYKELPRDVRAGRHAAAQRRPDRARRSTRVQRRARSTPRCRLGGELSNNKGINRQGGGLTAPALTAKDMEDIKTAMSFQADYLAVSLPEERDRHGHGAPAGQRRRRAVRPQAAADRQDRARRGDPGAARRSSTRRDGIMVARGDLAVEVGNAAVPALQKRMIRMARELEQARHHRDADDGVDDRQPGADARRSVATSPTRCSTAPTP